MPLFDVKDLPKIVQSTQLDSTSRSSGDKEQHIVTIHKLGEPPHQRYEEWSREELLGRGGYGEVWKEKCTNGNGLHERAVKTITLGKTSDLPDRARELEALIEFSQSKFSSFFPTFFGWYQMNQCLHIAMEYLPLGDLRPYVTNSKELDEKKDIVVIAQQIVKALQFMHNKGFAHRDLKPANIMVASGRNSGWRIKLIDFGNSKMLEKTQTTLALRGTAGYIAPDIILEAIDDQQPVSKGKRISRSKWFAADIWSLGEIIFQLFVKRFSFADQGAVLDYYFGSKEFPIQQLQSVGSSARAIDFVQRAMRAEPLFRIKINDAAAHAWINMADTLSTPTIVPNNSLTSSTRIEGPRYGSRNNINISDGEMGFIRWSNNTEMSRLTSPNGSPSYMHIAQTTNLFEAASIAGLIYLAAYSSDAKHLLTVSDDEIFIWIMESTFLLARIPAPSSRAKAVAIYASSDNTIFFAMILQNGDVVFGDTRTNATNPPEVVFNNFHRAISIAIGGEHMIALGCSDSTIEIIDANNRTKQSVDPERNNCTIKWIFFLQNRHQTMMSVCSKGTLRLWEYGRYGWSNVREQEFGQIEQLAFDSACRRLVIGRGHVFEVWGNRSATSLYQLRFEAYMSDVRINNIYINFTNHEITTLTENVASLSYRGGDCIPVFAISNPRGSSDEDCIAVSPSWPCSVVARPNRSIEMSHTKIEIEHKMQTNACDEDCNETCRCNRSPRVRVLKYNAHESDYL